MTAESAVRYKAYVVMTYYNYEGWNIVAERDTFQEALVERDHWLGMGNSKVQIFKPVHFALSEKDQI